MRWRWFASDNLAPPSVTPPALAVAVLTTLCLFLLQPARADFLRFRYDLDYLNSNVDFTNKTTGLTTTTDTSLFNQDYPLDFSKTLYPYLSLGGGVFYELASADASTGPLETESDRTFLQPYVRLDLNNPMYRGGLEYRRSEIESDFTGLPTEKDYRDAFDAIIGWQPVELPSLQLRYNQTHTYNDPDTVDRLEKYFNLESRYQPYDNLQFYYNYQRDSTDDRKRDVETVDQLHTGRVDYERRFMDDRLSLATSYRIDYGKQEIPALATVDEPVLPSAGLSALDDTPEDGALAINNALINGNLTASAGIDIGLGGDETTLTNIGLDLGLPTPVDQLLVWVDRRLSTAVSTAFSWDVYTSPDNTPTSDWTLVATVFPAPFGTFENRFEIRFTRVTTRFIKVVTRPLSPIIPGAVDYANIFVTELQPFNTVSGVNVNDERDRLSHDFSLNLTGRLNPRTVLGYDMYYRNRKQDLVVGTATADELSNGLFVNHTFSKVFSGSARVLRTDTSTDTNDIVDYSYSGSLRGDYFKNFYQTLIYSGTHTHENAGTSRSDSLFLRNNAVLYQGWSAYADVGYSIFDSFDQAQETDTTFRFGTNVVPNAKVNFNLDYTITYIDNTDVLVPDTTDTLWTFQVFYLPFRTLSLFGKITVRDREDTNTTLQNYSVNWSPFPDGALQVSFNYAETLRDPDNQRDRSAGPYLKWTVSRHIILESAYTLSQSESDTQKADTRSILAKMNLIF